MVVLWVVFVVYWRCQMLCCICCCACCVELCGMVELCGACCVSCSLVLCFVMWLSYLDGRMSASKGKHKKRARDVREGNTGNALTVSGLSHIPRISNSNKPSGNPLTFN